MITLEEATKIAKQRRKSINQCVEYANGYYFVGTQDEASDGGMESPVIVLKKDGKIVDMITFINSGTGKKLGTKSV